MNNSTEFPKATYRYDPYRSHKFRLKWDGEYVAGFSKVSALSRSVNVVTHRSGGDPSVSRQMPGQSEYPAITLERGVTHDPAFEQWANKVWDYHNSAHDDEPQGTSNKDVSLKDFRKDVVLELYNEAGQKVMAYTIFRCWPSEFAALPEMDADGNAVAISRLKLENQGWEKDTSIAQPSEHSFNKPSS
ncbi:phage tail protein [Pontixanthobacter aestiaquae]|uniref:Phage tail protein n=1 Tax=Pontixanthobacter aestiaquae TaxID=1509367 RepID=A0A844Z9U3_9SPHN|nr:phage tail protein [Pontixanthobacter aestiaquae]MDN3645215.1 phage tail protein [Pontixanthobacter aestiaquae]MXO83783.1 phage tail protein [Pontixanthobacter aestiaquae]